MSDNLSAGVDLEQAEESTTKIKNLIDEMDQKLAAITTLLNKRIVEGETSDEDVLLNVPWATVNVKDKWHEYEDTKINELLGEMKNRADNIRTSAEDIAYYANIH